MINNHLLSNWVVLLVDDEPDNLEVIATSLRFFGAKEVVTTTNGYQALDYLKTAQPDLILLDIAMPEMDGWDTLKHIRDEAQTKHLPVIALSAHAMQRDIDRAAVAGFDGYITKPVNIPTLPQEINHIIRTMDTRRAEMMSVSEWHILIIEDEVDSADMIAELLKQTSIQCTAVATAEEGLQRIETWQPTAIIIDLHLPGDDGWSLMKKLRANPETAKIPLIAITAYHSPTMGRQALEEGFDEFIAKPINVADFPAKISKVIRTKSG